MHCPASWWWRCFHRALHGIKQSHVTRTVFLPRVIFVGDWQWMLSFIDTSLVRLSAWVLPEPDQLWVKLGFGICKNQGRSLGDSVSTARRALHVKSVFSSSSFKLNPVSFSKSALLGWSWRRRLDMACELKRVLFCRHPQLRKKSTPFIYSCGKRQEQDQGRVSGRAHRQQLTIPRIPSHIPIFHLESQWRSWGSRGTPTVAPTAGTSYHICVSASESSKL